MLRMILDRIIATERLLLEMHVTQRRRIDELQERIEELESTATVLRGLHDLNEDEFLLYQTTPEANLHLEEEVDDEST